ncbi:MAG: hypothetical protein VYC62_02235 [Verrucomicrobiota bacterium]|nr:hypothetical protein [Verrucomicrobiota bacterium]
MTDYFLHALSLVVIKVKCEACGGESQFEKSDVGKEQSCSLCDKLLLVDSVKSPTELSKEDQMAQYEEALKESDWGHQPC